MNYSLINDRCSPRLILFFAGWGMDAKPFAKLTAPAGYDLAVVWDYRDAELTLPIESYEEICVVAWSFGVVSACRLIAENSSLPLTRCIAVAGTPFPVDDERGIPEAVFNATLGNLSVANLLKFYRRMAGSKAAYDAFVEALPERDVDELAEELRVIARLGNSYLPISIWDEVIVPASDRIIPYENQLKAWRGHSNLHTLESPHMVDFQSVIDRSIVAKDAMAQRFAESASTYDNNAVMQHVIAVRLADMWAINGFMGADGVAVEIGTGTGWLTRFIAPQLLSPDRLTLVDLTIPPANLPGRKVAADGELYVRQLADESVDLLFSASTVQWFNSPSKFLAECARVLRPGGVALLSTFGEQNYRELATYLASEPHYTSLVTLRQMLPESLMEVESQEWAQTVSFSSATDMLRHLRLTGVNASAGSSDASRRAMSIVRAGISELTYNPVVLLLLRR